MDSNKNPYLTPSLQVGDLFYTKDKHTLLVIEVSVNHHISFDEWKAKLLSYGNVKTLDYQNQTTSYTRLVDGVNQITVWGFGDKPHLNRTWKIIKCSRNP